MADEVRFTNCVAYGYKPSAKADLDDLKADADLVAKCWPFFGGLGEPSESVVARYRAVRDARERLTIAAPALLARLEQAEARLKELGVTL